MACVLRHLGHKLENGSLRNAVVLYDLFTSVFMFWQMLYSGDADGLWEDFLRYFSVVLVEIGM